MPPNVAPKIPSKMEKVGFLLAPRFSLLAYVCAIEPLRVANRLAGCELYRWRTISLDGIAVPASNDTAVAADHSLRDRPDYARIVICAGFEPEALYDRRVARWLQARDRAGVALVGIDTGSFVLAQAGLLDGYRACTHWESLESLRSQFPGVRVEAGLYAFDRKRHTCAGGTAALDMMLQLVRGQHGHRLAAAVAEQLLHARLREAGEPQRMGAQDRQALTDPGLVRAVEFMESHLEEPAPIGTICRTIRTTRRRLEREFSRQLHASPQRYYLNLRLQRARTLLQYTRLPVLDVAVATGFNSAAQFCRAYKGWSGGTPTAERLLVHQGIQPALQ